MWSKTEIFLSSGKATKVQDTRGEMIKARQSETSKFKGKLQYASQWDREAFKYLTIVVLVQIWLYFLGIEDFFSISKTANFLESYQ